MRRNRERLTDILEAISMIERYTNQGRESFERNELLLVWVIYHTQIIGEAVAGLSESLRINHPEVPWTQITAMRNIIVHQYFSIDIDEIWNTVERDLPKLKDDVLKILQEFQDEVFDYAQSLLKRKTQPKQKKLRMSWAGGLKEFRNEFTSLELQNWKQRHSF
jgi:uncharacterized protein with HEPN domain